MTNSGRPLSPHLSIYRWPVTMTLSILHRASGICLSIGLLMFAWWLVALSSGGTAYANFVDFSDSLLGRLMLVGWSLAFFYHLANGIRHLVFDVGRGFELKSANPAAWFVLLLTLLLTAAFWVTL